RESHRGAGWSSVETEAGARSPAARKADGEIAVEERIDERPRARAPRRTQSRADERIGGPDERPWRSDERAPRAHKRTRPDERSWPNQWATQRRGPPERAHEWPRPDQGAHERIGEDERPDKWPGPNQRHHERTGSHERAHKRVGWSTSGGLPCFWSARDGPEHGMETVPHSARQRRAPAGPAFLRARIRGPIVSHSDRRSLRRLESSASPRRRERGRQSGHRH